MNRSHLGRVLTYLRTRTSAVGLALPVIAYLILSLAGITTSSIGIDYLRADPENPIGVQIGASQDMRSDEFWTESPIWLGQMARGGAEDPTPLSVSNDFFAQLPAGPASSVVFLDGTILGLSGVIPDNVLFAAKWWLPSLLLFLGLPVWFRIVTGSSRWGFTAAALMFVAPATSWWSGRPINTIGFVAAGCALVLVGSSHVRGRRFVRAALAFIVAGALLARLPSYYQPLAIVVGLPLVIATAAVLLTEASTRRARVASIASTLISGGMWTCLLFWENRAAIAAGLSTVYPGDRQSTGSAVDVGTLFGATTLGWLEPLSRQSFVSQPELVTAFNVLVIAVLALVITRVSFGARSHRAATICVLVCLGAWLLWCTFDWGSLGGHIPLANRVPPHRAAQGLGYIVILCFALMMSRRQERASWRVPLVAGLSSAVLSGYAGSVLQQGPLPGMTTLMIWGSAAATGAVVALLLRWPQRWWSLIIAIAAASSITVTAQPILIGLGDLRSSPAATSFLDWGEEAVRDDQYWASDSRHVDALMLATGTPSLSTRQQIGPDSAAWRKLDPEGQYEDLWNRGGLHITFSWNDSDEIVMTQPFPDVVVINASPCAVATRMEGLRHIVSSAPLQDSCLRSIGEIQWSGAIHHVYEIEPRTDPTS